MADPEIVGGAGCVRSRGVECVEGVPLPMGEGYGWGSVPPPQNFFSPILDLKMASFGALWVPVGDASPSSSPPPGSATDCEIVNNY